MIPSNRVIIHAWVVWHEEAALLRRLGDGYARDTEHVPRWLVSLCALARPRPDCPHGAHPLPSAASERLIATTLPLPAAEDMSAR